MNIERRYPELTLMMDHCLYQEAEPTFEEAITNYALNGEDAVRTVLSEIEEVLNLSYSAQEILSYVSDHSDYLENESGIETLELIRFVLGKINGVGESKEPENQRGQV